MKKIVTIIVCLAVCIVGGWAFLAWDGDINPAPVKKGVGQVLHATRAAVQAVMDSYRAAYSESLFTPKFFGQPQKPVPNLKNLSATLTTVDTSQTPADFRAAWMHYVESLTDTRKISPADLLSLGDGGAILAANVISNGQQNRSNQAAAYEALSLTAASYGVTNW